MAFTDSITAIAGVEPKRPEEVDVDAPELELLMVDFLSELVYRFDTRAWLTRTAALAVHEKDGGWALEGTLTGERLDPARHPVKDSDQGRHVPRARRARAGRHLDGERHLRYLICKNAGIPET